MTVHDEILELAAAAIDFELTSGESSRVAEHLSGCSSCRGRVAEISADQRAMASLRPMAIDGVQATMIWSGVRRQRPSTIPVVRLVLLAGLLALLALAAAAVGGAILRDASPRLGLTQPTTGLTATTLQPSPPARSASPPGAFAAGAFVDVAVRGLRVRTAPTVDDALSAKLEPLLNTGAHLKVIGGPVRADGYDWYEIQALDLPHRGWVAAADHDGNPWIQDVAAARAAASFSPDEQALVDALRRDAAVGCEPRRTAMPSRSTAGVDCGVHGAVVGNVGAYRFKDGGDAARTYLERMASYAVKPATGKCAAGTPGDAPWLSKDRPSSEPNDITVGAETRSIGRSGCFLNENDIANVRVTCGSMYVGVLGVDGDIAALYEWVWGFAGGPAAAGSPPSICRLAS